MAESRRSERPPTESTFFWRLITVLLGVALVALVALAIWKPSLFDLFGAGRLGTQAAATPSATVQNNQEMHRYRIRIKNATGEAVKGALLRAATDTSDKAITDTSDERGAISLSLPVPKGEEALYHVVVEPPQNTSFQKAAYDIRWDKTNKKWQLQEGNLPGLAAENDQHVVTLSDSAPRSAGNQLAQGAIADVRGSYIRADGIRTVEEGITVLLANGFITSRGDVTCTWQKSFTRKGVVEAFRDGVSMGMANVVDLRPQAGALCEVKGNAKGGKGGQDWFFVEAKCANVVSPPKKQPPTSSPPQQPDAPGFFSLTARAQHNLAVVCPAPRETTVIATVTGIGNLETGSSRNPNVNVAFVEAQNEALNKSLPSAIADAENKRAEVLRNTQLLLQRCGFETLTPALFTGAAIAPFSATVNCAPSGNQLAGSGTVVVSSTNLFGRSLASIQSTISQADANAKAQAIATAEADERQRELEARAQNNRDQVCGTMSQPSFAKDRILADQTEGTANQPGTFTVTGSAEPDRPPPTRQEEEQQFNNPVQGTNPEPIQQPDSNDGFAQPPPPAPQESTKPTSPNSSPW